MPINWIAFAAITNSREIPLVSLLGAGNGDDKRTRLPISSPITTERTL